MGRLFVNQISAAVLIYSVAAFIRVAVVNRSFTVTAHLLGKKEKMKDLTVTVC